MLGPSIAIALMAQVGGEAPAGAAPPAAQAKTADRCPTLPNAQPGEIVVCGERPQGYRLDLDVIEASRGKRAAARSSARAAPRHQLRSGWSSRLHRRGRRGQCDRAVLTAAGWRARLIKGRRSEHVRHRPAPDRISALCGSKRARGRGGEAALEAKVKANAEAAAAAKAGGVNTDHDAPHLQDQLRKRLSALCRQGRRRRTHQSRGRYDHPLVTDIRGGLQAVLDNRTDSNVLRRGAGVNPCDR